MYRIRLVVEHDRKEIAMHEVESERLVWAMETMLSIMNALTVPFEKLAQIRAIVVEDEDEKGTEN